MNTMNYAICLGFQIWYSLMPSIMLSIGYYDINELLSPEVVNVIKDTTLEWSDQMIKYTTVLCANLYSSIIQSAGVTVDGSSGVSTSVAGSITDSNETGIFDPLEIRTKEIHKGVLRKLVIACFTVCFFSSISYITASGNSLRNHFYGD